MLQFLRVCTGEENVCAALNQDERRPSTSHKVGQQLHASSHRELLCVLVRANHEDSSVGLVDGVGDGGAFEVRGAQRAAGARADVLRGHVDAVEAHGVQIRCGIRSQTLRTSGQTVSDVTK